MSLWARVGSGKLSQQPRFIGSVGPHLATEPARPRPFRLSGRVRRSPSGVGNTHYPHYGKGQQNSREMACKLYLWIPITRCTELVTEGSTDKSVHRGGETSHKSLCNRALLRARGLGSVSGDWRVNGRPRLGRWWGQLPVWRKTHGTGCDPPHTRWCMCVVVMRHEPWRQSTDSVVCTVIKVGGIARQSRSRRRASFCARAASRCK